jgi:DNA-binding CsgD family transcriptional regulator
MVKFIIILVFLVSVAITAGSILISSKLRNNYPVPCLSTLMYFQTFYFTFGFYAIWGQLILFSVLSSRMTGELMGKTTTMLTLLGAPFMMITWLMLLKFTRELSGRKTGYLFVLAVLLLTAMLVLGMAYWVPKLLAADAYTTMKYGFILIHLVYTLAGVSWLLFTGMRGTILRKTDMRNMASGLFVTMLLQNMVLIFYAGDIYLAMFFILIFFLGGAFLPVYLRYKSDLSVLLTSAGSKLSFEELCRNFDISAREKDVIREICHGLSNRQIADKLFISLQTVKDHTSRIYYKTNCSSRAQLITMIKDLD